MYITIVTYKCKGAELKKMTKTILKALVDQEKSITALAREIKRSRVHTSNVINCRFVNPPMPTVKLIAKALGIPLDDLLSNNNDQKRAA